LENRLAELGGHEDALLQPSGYSANLCWIWGCMSQEDIFLYDKYSHASTYDALKAIKNVKRPFDPDNLDTLENLCRRYTKARKGNIYVAVEGVRSIDGTIVNLPKLVNICDKYGALVVLDDAHALGVLGDTGKGTMEHYGLKNAVHLRISTCSKALGAQGAFVSGSQKSIQYLRNNSNPYIFTTSMTHPVIAAINAALDILEREPDRIKKLHENRCYLINKARCAGFDVKDSSSGIVPLYVTDSSARDLCASLFTKGLFVNMMEHPMIPSSWKEYLRFSLMSDHSYADIDRALEILMECYHPILEKCQNMKMRA
jgi:glycine C-acetyltransferase